MTNVADTDAPAISDERARSLTAICNLAAIVKLQNGNLHEDINAVLADANEVAAALRAPLPSSVTDERISILVYALKQAEEWLNGWASAEPQLVVIQDALSAASLPLRDDAQPNIGVDMVGLRDHLIKFAEKIGPLYVEDIRDCFASLPSFHEPAQPDIDPASHVAAAVFGFDPIRQKLTEEEQVEFHGFIQGIVERALSPSSPKQGVTDEEVEVARKALAAWDQYNPNVDLDDIVSQAEDLAKSLRALIASALVSGGDK